MIVVTLTSWTKRINHCKDVIKSILDNTMKPHRVYLNLSLEEFPNKLNDLPVDLISFIKKEPSVIINWVNGENTKTMKKVFPILKYLNDDDIIIYTDDDILFPKDLIEKRINEFNRHKSPITSVLNRYDHMLYGLKLSGVASLVQKKMLKDWELFCNDEVIHTYEDDHVYTILCFINGYFFQTAKHYPKYILLRNYCKTTEYAASKINLYNAKNTDEILEKRYNELYKKNFKIDVQERDKR